MGRGARDRRRWTGDAVDARVVSLYNGAAKFAAHTTVACLVDAMSSLIERMLSCCRYQDARSWWLPRDRGDGRQETEAGRARHVRAIFLRPCWGSS
jgi:hypothetical protein